MATAADWMSAASFLSMAGLIAFLGYSGSVYLMGWTGGFVLLALLIAPYLRRFNRVTVAEFVGDRFASTTARTIAVVCSLFISFTYIAGQMKGVGVVFSRFLDVPFEIGIFTGMAVVFIYAVLGGMKGITYTQVAQYCVMIFAYTVPAIFISITVTGDVFPQLGLVGTVSDGAPLLSKLDQVVTDLGFAAYTQNTKTQLDMLAITAALMFGTAGLPHVIIRFFTVPSTRAARLSAGYALIFIAILYLTAPAVAAFARINFIAEVENAHYSTTAVEREQLVSEDKKVVPQWFLDWETTTLVSFEDKNADGVMQIRGPQSSDGVANEVEANRDIFVLANPQIARLPAWVVALVIAGGLAAALSTAAGLLMVISSAISHDICRRTLFPQMTDRTELLTARCASGVTVVLAGILGIYASELGFVAQVVAFAFGLAAATIFPVLLLGIFWERSNAQGIIAAMLVGLTTTATYICYFKFWGGTPEQYWFSISPEGIGFIFMWLALGTGVAVSLLTPPPNKKLQQLARTMHTPSASI